MKEVIVKSQGELDSISIDYAGRIYIEFGTRFAPGFVNKKYLHPVVAHGNFFVVARENSSVEARENSSVVARENSSVVAWENSSVEAYGNSSVVAWENSSVEAYRNSSVEARGNSSVEAWENSSVVARENSSVVARENSSVVARENSSVVARENSSVVAWENSSVVARENSSVVARENSSVVAWENSSVVASGNCQTVNKGTRGELSTSGNARIVYDPKNIQEYCDFYGIKLDNGVGRFFKSVHKDGGRYFSNHNKIYSYKIGEVCTPDFFDNSTEEKCGHGIHVAYLNWALEFGKSWDDLAILEVEARLDDIVVPAKGNGKVRCKEVKVLREVPLEECGLMGKFLSRKKKE